MRAPNTLIPALLSAAFLATPVLAASPAPSPTPETPPAEPSTVEACDEAFDACLLRCEKENPHIAGEMLCTGCGWDCNVVHKKCVAKAYYRKMFGD